jgi:hypothetical protein
VVVVRLRFNDNDVSPKEPTDMFTIHTAAPGETYHKFHPVERLGHAVPEEGFDSELEMHVRCDHGLRDPQSLEVRFFYRSSFSRECWEVLTYEDSGTPQATIDYCAKLESHLRAMLTLGLFQLPTTN